MIRVDPSYTHRRVGEQLLAHYAHRNAVRHATPLFPFSLRSLLQRDAPSQSSALPPAGAASSRA